MASSLRRLGAAALLWLALVCRMSLLDYGLTFLFPGAALTLVGSFAEHRADEIPAHRVAVVERAPVLGLLFLNNNLHALHHARPGPQGTPSEVLHPCSRGQEALRTPAVHRSCRTSA